LDRGGHKQAADTENGQIGVLEPFGRHRQYDDRKDHRIHGEDEAGYPEAEGIQLQ
jgi:hypothetical protein